MDEDTVVDICADQCGAACCSGAIFLGDEDVARIRDAGYAEFATDRDGARVMRTTETGECRFLSESDTCSIYGDRPIDCRLFPLGFTIEGDSVDIVLVACPLAEQMPDELIADLTAEAKRLLRTYSEPELRAYDRLPFTAEYSTVDSVPLAALVDDGSA